MDEKRDEVRKVVKQCGVEDKGAMQGLLMFLCRKGKS